MLTRCGTGLPGRMEHGQTDMIYSKEPNGDVQVEALHIKTAGAFNSVWMCVLLSGLFVLCTGKLLDVCSLGLLLNMIYYTNIQCVGLAI